MFFCGLILREDIHFYLSCSTICFFFPSSFFFFFLFSFSLSHTYNHTITLSLRFGSGINVERPPTTRYYVLIHNERGDPTHFWAQIYPPQPVWLRTYCSSSIEAPFFCSRVLLACRTPDSVHARVDTYGYIKHHPGSCASCSLVHIIISTLLSYSVHVLETLPQKVRLLSNISPLAMYSVISVDSSGQPHRFWEYWVPVA